MHCIYIIFIYIPTKEIAKDCLLTLVKGRLALGSPGCSFVRDHAENGPIHRKMVADYTLVIHRKNPFSDQTKSQRKRNNWSSESFAKLILGFISHF